jgi:large subunit ribosomal protein L6
MSKLGRMPIILPDKVEVKIDGNKVLVKGPKGNLDLLLADGVEVVVDKKQVLVKAARELSVLHGLSRALLNNCIVGVSAGFEKRLAMVGVGYRAAVKGNFLDLQIGLSHQCQVPIPKGIKVEVDKNNEIIITGIDRQLVGQFAAEVRGKKSPEPYKGKGIRYKDEFVRKKAGKAAKGKTATNG